MEGSEVGIYGFRCKGLGISGLRAFRFWVWGLH